MRAMEIGERIAAARKKAGQSQGDLGRRVNVGQSTVAQWEAGKNQPSIEKLKEIGEVLEVTGEWLAFGGDAPAAKPMAENSPVDNSSQTVAPRDHRGLTFDLRERPHLTRDLPIRGHTRAGKQGLFLDQGETWGFAMRPESLRGVKDAYAVRVADNSMEPRYEHGNVLQVDPHRDPKPGDNVVIQLKDGQAFLKRLVRRTERALICDQFNPKQTVEYLTNTVSTIHMVVGIDYLER